LACSNSWAADIGNLLRRVQFPKTQTISNGPKLGVENVIGFSKGGMARAFD
jgi:hypothetical protein